MTDEQLLVDTSDLVHIDNTETINGLKYFSHDTVVANASQMITNCITEIPQNIKVDIVNGNPVLRAGSKVYDGNGLFNTLTTDSAANISYSANQKMYYYEKARNTLLNFHASKSGSGATLPSDGNTYLMFYNTTDKKVYRWLNNTWTSAAGYSLPIFLGTDDGTSIISIDQLFNGFGYIGSSIFALPGVKGLIPDGRNTDGSLKNITCNITSVRVYNFNSTAGTNDRYITLGGSNHNDLSVSAEISSGTTYYDENENWFHPNDIDYTIRWMNAGKLSINEGKIVYFNPKTPFHTLDYSDKETIAGWSMPGNRYVNLTLLASGSTYTAPANGWLDIRKSGSDQEYLKITGLIEACASASGSNVISLFVPMKKGDTVKLTYTASGTTHVFRFVYAEGEQ